MDVESPAQPANNQAAPAPAQQFGGYQQDDPPGSLPRAPAQAQAGANAGGLPFGMTQDQREGKITDVISFTGTDREQAVAALRAAFFDVNTAVNYVFEGIPANLGG